MEKQYHLYVSVASFGHKCFKYAGMSEEKNLSENIRYFSEKGVDHETGPFRVLVMDKYYGDKIKSELKTESAFTSEKDEKLDRLTTLFRMMELVKKINATSLMPTLIDMINNEGFTVRKSEEPEKDGYCLYIANAMGWPVLKDSELGLNFKGRDGQ